MSYPSNTTINKTYNHIQSIYIAHDAGYCYGVDDAIELVVEKVNKSKQAVYTYGPIIHNPRTIEDLESKHIYAINEPEEVQGKTVAIRAHGIPPKKLQSFIDADLEVLDATCPFVKSTQKIARQLADAGYFVVILGKKKHPEVIGIHGHVEDCSHIIQTEDDLEGLSWHSKIGVVFQSTVTVDDFQHILDKLPQYCNELKVKRTICGVTTKRQKTALRMSELVDFIVIIGGRNSSNTIKLAEVCESKVPTVHIENVEEINKVDLSLYSRIGISSGTSTPRSFVNDVIDEIRHHSSNTFDVYEFNPYQQQN